MLPSVVAGELKQAVSQFLRSAFPIATPFFQRSQEAVDDPHALIDGLLREPGGLFKGPYLDIKLPFCRAAQSELPFRHLQIPFAPYRHQLTAFQRLCGDAPQSTIVATGTGSGKTECFMYPVLDDCLERREQGIKTIVVYPMNALANDQARRFAEEVQKLDTKLTVGLFVGGEQKQAHTTMGPDQVITCQKTLRENPPDILLTNYKMLDFLLIRPKDRPLWRYNRPGTLRYLVVDELHTFDGAQGTDLACLVRRLRDRLEAAGELACVGTSATMGAESLEELLGYASQVFATEFQPNAVIGEDRESPDEYLLGTREQDRDQRRERIRYFSWPDRDEQRLNPQVFDRSEDYLFHQARVWFPELLAAELPQFGASDPRIRAEAAVQMGELLHKHQAFHELVRATQELRDLGELATDWQQRLNLPTAEQGELLLASLVALVSASRLWHRPGSENPEQWVEPFLQVRKQLWLRELRRLVCSVPHDGQPPKIRFADDLQDPEKPLLHLPLLHCRECNLAAWGGVSKQGSGHLICNLQTFYQAWFGYSPQARLLAPVANGHRVDAAAQAFCARCQRLQQRGSEGKCVECENATLIDVWVPDMVRARRGNDDGPLRCHHDCPECGARESLAVMGYRAATLTSVMAGRLFATPYNDDWKLIAFSDSVQDAAHRAGFLGANTWRQTFRQAMALWLKDQPVALPLQETAEMFPAYWRDRINHDGRFCGMFIAPNMGWLADYHRLTERGELPGGSDLPDLVTKRLAWECLTEFGRRGTVGRSLERTGTAAIGLDGRRLSVDVGKLAGQLREESGSLRELDDAAFLQFVLGLFQHMRRSGAIYDPVLESYLRERGKEYLLNRLPWMPGYGRSQRPPAAITLQHVAPNFEGLTQSSRDTWAVRWLKKTLGQENVFAAAEARQVFVLTMNALERAGWLVEREAAGQPLWLLDPARLRLGFGAMRLECSECRRPLHVAPDVARLHEGMPCLRGHCLGQLQQAAGQRSRPRDYGVTIPRRLVPSEHTGLLPRDVREAVEQSFTRGSEPWDINLLSATPTLEMGIDIGALSSVFLCSVPPAQANYLQRVGRAGRRDGNALAVTVANGQNHDLFFYADPMEMIAGAVHTPGVFLKAIAVLERQLIAYCFDRWNASGIDESAIPGQMRKVLDAVEYQKADQFPHTLIAFVRKHRMALMSGFFELFPELDDDAHQYLERFIHNDETGGLEWRLLNRLQELVKERQSLLKKVKQLKAERERLKKLPEDEATRHLIDAVEHERSALLSLLHSMNVQHVLNFFTDEGLLPNYAFPEEGVTLRSVILRRKSREERKGGDSPFEKTPYVFQRPAQSALGEFAPESRFYAISHQMEIDQVDLELCEAEEWRFCAQCHYNERVDLHDRHSACPRCLSAQWADSGQKHTVLQLKKVYSTVDDRADRIGDDSEQREPRFFNRQMLVDIPELGRQGGFRLKSDNLPFGFEFLQRVILREVNFGPAGGETNCFPVAGRELPRRGFRICRYCGKVQKDYFRRNEQPHTYTCRLRKYSDEDNEAAYFDSLYLYRQLSSEAIRILLPLSEVAYSDAKLHSFVASLNLGLRAYFRGDVHHLNVTTMSEPATSHSGERVYLVIYDRIPGGTGYLKELMRSPDKLMEVLEKAWQRLTTCSCIDEEHLDGCYRCILAYRDSRKMPTISRKGAAELLGEILALRDQLESVESLSDISTNALIESKLEQKFIDALGLLPGAQMSRTTFKGKAGYLLTLPGADDRPMPWLVEHQVKVGAEQGVAVQTEIDVLLTPARAEDSRNFRPIAVYLDGLQYHHAIVADDVVKRSALLLSGRYWVYSLNWDDIPEPGKPPKGHEQDVMRVAGVEPKMTEFHDRLAAKRGWLKASDHGALHTRSALEWLTELLRDPSSACGLLAQRAWLRGFTALAPQSVKDTTLRENLAEKLQEMAPTHVREALAVDEPDRIPGGIAPVFGQPENGVSLVASLPFHVMQPGGETDVLGTLRVHLCFDDVETIDPDAFKRRWRDFWHAANQLQFAPGFSMATRKAVDTGAMDQLWQAWQIVAPPVVSAEEEAVAADAGWKEVFEASLLAVEQLRALMALGVREPLVGEDLATEEGEVILGGDVVELVWRDERVAVVDGNVPQVPEGWRLIPADSSMVDSVRALIEQGVM